MFIRKDITDLNPNENLHEMANDLAHYMVNDLIFTSAGIMMWDPEIKVGDNGGGSCVNVEWEHGDNVEW